MSEEFYYGELLKDITHGNEPIENWNKEEIGNFLFFWKHIYEDFKETSGFRIKVIKWRTEDDEGERYESVMEVTAYFDGVRHLHLGDEKLGCGLGYFNYPNIESFILIFQRIREMEKEFLSNDFIDKDLSSRKEVTQEEFLKEG